MGLMSYYLEIDVMQLKKKFSSHKKDTQVLKKFNMLDCKPINTLIKCGIKLSKMNQKEIDSILFKILLGNLRYLTCIRLDILFAIRLGGRFIENLSNSHMKVAKRILYYLKGTLELVGYYHSDFARDLDKRKTLTL